MTLPYPWKKLFHTDRLSRPACGYYLRLLLAVIKSSAASLRKTQKMQGEYTMGISNPTPSTSWVRLVFLAPLWLTPLTGYSDVCENAIKAFGCAICTETGDSITESGTRKNSSGKNEEKEETNRCQKRKLQQNDRLKNMEEILKEQGCSFIRQPTKTGNMCIVKLQKDIHIHSTLVLDESTLVLPDIPNTICDSTHFSDSQENEDDEEYEEFKETGSLLKVKDHFFCSNPTRTKKIILVDSADRKKDSFNHYLSAIYFCFLGIDCNKAYMANDRPNRYQNSNDGDDMRFSDLKENGINNNQESKAARQEMQQNKINHYMNQLQILAESLKIHADNQTDNINNDESRLWDSVKSDCLDKGGIKGIEIVVPEHIKNQVVNNTTVVIDSVIVEKIIKDLLSFKIDKEVDKEDKEIEWQKSPLFFYPSDNTSHTAKKIKYTNEDAIPDSSRNDSMIYFQQSGSSGSFSGDLAERAGAEKKRKMAIACFSGGQTERTDTGAEKKRRVDAVTRGEFNSHDYLQCSDSRPMSCSSCCYYSCNTNNAPPHHKNNPLVDFFIISHEGHDIFRCLGCEDNYINTTTEETRKKKAAMKTTD